MSHANLLLQPPAYMWSPIKREVMVEWFRMQLWPAGQGASSLRTLWLLTEPSASKHCRTTSANSSGAQVLLEGWSVVGFSCLIGELSKYSRWTSWPAEPPAASSFAQDVGVKARRSAEHRSPMLEICSVDIPDGGSLGTPPAMHQRGLGARQKLRAQPAPNIAEIEPTILPR